MSGRHTFLLYLLINVDRQVPKKNQKVQFSFWDLPKVFQNQILIVLPFRWSFEFFAQDFLRRAGLPKYRANVRENIYL